MIGFGGEVKRGLPAVVFGGGIRANAQELAKHIGMAMGCGVVQHGHAGVIRQGDILAYFDEHGHGLNVAGDGCNMDGSAALTITQARIELAGGIHELNGLQVVELHGSVEERGLTDGGVHLRAALDELRDDVVVRR